MGKKYIIEFSEDPHTIRLLKLKNGDKYPVTEFKTVTPYTEPDLEQVREEAYEKGYENGFVAGHLKAEKSGQSFYEDGYQKGLSDAWDAAKKIAYYWIWGGQTNEAEEIFGTDDIIAIFKSHSATEAIEKIRQYEQEKEEPKKEQSVTAEEVMRQYLDTFCKGKSCTGCPLHTPDFTCGRGYHFLTNKQVSDEEVRKAYAAVLAKMKE